MDATASMAACLIASSPSLDAVLSSSSLAVVVVVDVDELLLTNKRRAGPTVPTNNPDGSSLCTSSIAALLTSRVRMPMATSCAHRVDVASPGIVGVCVCGVCRDCARVSLCEDLSCFWHLTSVCQSVRSVCWLMYFSSPGWHWVFSLGFAAKHTPSHPPTGQLIELQAAPDEQEQQLWQSYARVCPPVMSAHL